MSKAIKKPEQPKIYKVKQIIQEAQGFKTFRFQGKMELEAGQFIMFWIPGLDMKPFSVSSSDGEYFEITAMKIGDFTQAMFNLKVGDQVGIQGPYGRGFQISEKNNIVIMGGGCGIAPINLLVERAQAKNKNITFIGGCRNQAVFLKREKIAKLIKNCYFTTDDGSFGEKGFTTEILEKLIKKGQKIDQILACGPEIMLYKCAKIAVKNNIACQVSLERMMKCAIGICGQCVLDGSGIRVCKDGPVLSAEKALTSPEFGSYKRDERGRIVKA
ncbi:MAG: dihydroorotate dehydrogenase electron transfer subunit [Candidatus Moranbacteria bacterium]|nr:dihydroorotate dehydrogenase electron transfer subunit [Candidatus Moranbacteria bacterium]